MSTKNSRFHSHFFIYYKKTFIHNRTSGDFLREKYEQATQVKMNKRGRLQVRDSRFKVPTALDLVYLDESPDWCRVNKQLQWTGECWVENLFGFMSKYSSTLSWLWLQARMAGNAIKHRQDSTAAPCSAVAEATTQRKLLFKSAVIVSSSGVAVSVATRANELSRNTHVNKLKYIKNLLVVLWCGTETKWRNSSVTFYRENISP